MTEHTAGLTNQAVELKAAGFWLRAGAYLLDNVVVALVLGVPEIFILGMLGIHGNTSHLRLVVRLANVGLAGAYFTFSWARCRGATIGKQFAGIRVIRTDGSTLTLGRALLRWIGYVLSSLTLMIGFMVALFTDRKRALHDYLADTRVVEVEPISGLRKAVLVGTALFIPGMAILGIVAAIAIPQFARLQNRAQESNVILFLSLVRTNIGATYAEHKTYPAGLSGVLKEAKIPKISVGSHAATDTVELYGAEVCSTSKDNDRMILGESLRDTGGWGYVSDPKASCYGHVFIDCTHKRIGGKEWYRY